MGRSKRGRPSRGKGLQPGKVVSVHTHRVEPEAELVRRQRTWKRASTQTNIIFTIAAEAEAAGGRLTWETEVFVFEHASSNTRYSRRGLAMRGGRAADTITYSNVHLEQAQRPRAACRQQAGRRLDRVPRWFPPGAGVRQGLRTRLTQSRKQTCLTQCSQTRALKGKRRGAALRATQA